MNGSVTIIFLLLCSSASLLSAETLHPVKLEKGELQKWCAPHDKTQVRFSNLMLEQEGYSRCGSVQTVALCGPLGEKYIGPATDAPPAYKDCQLGPRIYIEKDGVPVDVASVMNTPEERGQEHRDERGHSFFTDVTPDEGLSATEAFGQIDQVLSPILHGPYGKLLEELLGEPLPDIRGTGRNLQRHLDSYPLGDGFFEDK
ncbi:MAG: hypothetical protein KDD55_12825 [Bdellovibrionales bacterium]|nr:hypothetical protein [Bdellovibrionales bacterium]